MFKTILVPIDDSEGSRDVAGAICKMVADWRCRVIFVNVVDTAPIIAATSEAFVDPKGVIDEMRRVAPEHSRRIGEDRRTVRRIAPVADRKARGLVEADHAAERARKRLMLRAEYVHRKRHPGCDDAA